jgi:very-short-patch-repair endonuclease
MAHPDGIRAYESPIEEALGERLAPMLADGVALRTQVGIATVAGRFRLDFMVEAPGLRLAIECDGAKFHNGGDDEWRDAVTLGDDQADAVVRFRGTDIVHRLDDCIFVLAYWYPEIFSERGRANSVGRSSAAAGIWRRSYADGFSNRALIHYGEQRCFMLSVERQGFGLVKRAFWVTAFGFALAHPGLSIPQLRSLYLAGTIWETKTQ